MVRVEGSSDGVDRVLEAKGLSFVTFLEGVELFLKFVFEFGDSAIVVDSFSSSHVDLGLETSCEFFEVCDAVGLVLYYPSKTSQVRLL